MKNLLENWDCNEETYEEVLKRYKGYGSELFTCLKGVIPDIFAHLTFYKSVKCDDVLAIFENQEYNFAIQLAPISEVIVVWNDKMQVEIGTWSNYPIQETIDIIQEYFLIENKQ